MPNMRTRSALFLLLLLAACGRTAVPPVAPPDTSAWPRHAIPVLGLAFAYPPGWHVFDGGKSLQITPHSQPTWSSYAPPDLPNDGPTFDLLYNLNRQMGATASEEIAALLRGYAGQLEVVAPAGSPPGRTDLVGGVYRFPGDGSLLLLGAVETGDGRVVSLLGAGAGKDTAELRRFFDGVLHSITTGEQ